MERLTLTFALWMIATALSRPGMEKSAMRHGESLGVGVRVMVDESWGFAATDDMSREAVERTAAKAVDIARASARVKEQPIRLAPEPPAKAEWTTPYKIDPFTTSVEENLICC